MGWPSKGSLLGGWPAGLPILLLACLLLPSRSACHSGLRPGRTTIRPPACLAPAPPPPHTSPTRPPAGPAHLRGRRVRGRLVCDQAAWPHPGGRHHFGGAGPEGQRPPARRECAPSWRRAAAGASGLRGMTRPCALALELCRRQPRGCSAPRSEPGAPRASATLPWHRCTCALHPPPPPHPAQPPTPRVCPRPPPTPTPRHCSTPTCRPPPSSQCFTTPPRCATSPPTWRR